MSPSHSRSLTISLGSVILYFLVGCLIYISIPVPDPSETAVAVRDLLFNEYPNPEPKETYTYLGLILLTPLIVGLCVLVHRTLVSGVRAPVYLIPILLMVGSMTALVPESWEGGLALEPGAPVTVGFLLVILFCWIIQGKINSKGALEDIVRNAVIPLVVMAGLLLNVCWRVFDYHSVIERGSYFSHFDAAIYSIVQISRGATCLVDIVPQYGCYGEILLPIFAAFGTSILSITIVMTLLVGASFLLITYVVLRVVSNPYIALSCLICLIFVILRTWWDPIDPNFQSMPIRLVVPAIAMWAGFLWHRRPTGRGALLLGLVGGLALVWNLDSGAVVFGALALLIVMQGTTRAGPWGRPFLAGKGLMLGTYLLATVLVVAAFGVFLRMKGGAWPDVADYVVYQQIFASSGIFTLPMRAEPSTWHFMIALAIVAVATFANHMGRGGDAETYEYIAFVAILSVGLFSYHVGRSHPMTLGLVAWPFVPLLFMMIDRAWRSGIRESRIGTVLFVSWLSVATAVIASANVMFVPRAVRSAIAHYEGATGSPPALSIAPQVAFIKEHTSPADSVVVVALNQASLLAESGLRSALDGPGQIETLRRSDADSHVRQMLDEEKPQLFIGYTICCDPKQPDQIPWLRAAMPTLKERYALAGWDPSGTLMRLVPRSLGVPDLFEVGTELDPSERTIRFDPVSGIGSGFWGRPVTLPVKGPVLLGTNFQVSVRFLMHAEQKESATILSNRGIGDQGFSIERHPSGQFQVFTGVGTNFMASGVFAIAEGEHSIEVTSTEGALRVRLDGDLIPGGNDLRVGESPAELAIGTGGFEGRELNADLLQFTARQGS